MKVRWSTKCISSSNFAAFNKPSINRNRNEIEVDSAMKCIFNSKSITSQNS